MGACVRVDVPARRCVSVCGLCMLVLSPVHTCQCVPASELKRETARECVCVCVCVCVRERERACVCFQNDRERKERKKKAGYPEKCELTKVT